MVGSAGLLDVHAKALEAYRSFVESFVRIRDDRLRDFVLTRLREGEFWPEPFLSLSAGYELAGSVDQLAEEGLIHPTTARIFRREDGSPFHLFRHQVEAIQRAVNGKSFVLTSGTGSGKSFAYFIPIVDTVVRHPGLPGPVALVVYPMNALVNSQLKALEELKARYERRYGHPFPLRFARYTGETDEDTRRRIREERPHLILTNYVMLEYFMVRPDDRSLVSPPEAKAPFFLVFDELHTYRGRRGADVALLVRRIRARLPGGRKVVHIGTSATLVARKDASREERRQVVSRFASRFFGHPLDPSDVVEETLRPVTEGGPPSPEELRKGLSQPLPTEAEAFRRYPLARFLEWSLGLEEEAPGIFRRKTPRTLEAAAGELAQHAGLSLGEALKRLKDTLLQATRLKDESGRPLFAPKLHQFLSQTRSVYATLEPPDRRAFRMEPSLGSPPHFPMRFCRNCGLEHYLVVWDGARYRPHPEQAEGVVGEEGYLTYWPYPLEPPQEWYDDKGKLKSNWKERVPQEVLVDPEGRVHSTPQEGTARFLWQKAPFILCPGCGEYYTGREGEFRKLTYLGSEGRTSAGTVMALSLLRSAKETLGEGRDKLLSFTDNRQDAALQAGHFNDFVRAVLLRAALRKALEEHRELHHPDPPEVAGATLEAVDLPLSEYAQNPGLDPVSTGGMRAREVMRKVVLYRLYEDLRREWRFTQPNLEDVGLLEIAYRDLDSPLLLERLLQAVPLLAGRDKEELRAGLKEFMDILRKALAVDAFILKEDFSQLRRQSEEHLNEFWALGEDDQPLYPATLVLGVGEGSARGRVKGPQVKLSPRSRLGKLLRRLGLEEKDYLAFLQALVAFGLLKPVDGGYRIPESALIWRKGEGHPQANPFFRDLYRLEPRELLGLEAREHTAQVVAPGEREKRERRFRFTEEDRNAQPGLKRLPFLVASPTLELGVDIADLDMVHLRNIPPTPANYAQRSGRAGRQGQMGLILAFAGAYNHHDQYFFRHRDEMVAGAVRAPSLDLANEALLKAHIQAEWLASTGLALRDSILATVNVHDQEYPLYAEVQKALALSEGVQKALVERLWRILEPDWQELEREGFDRTWVEGVVRSAPTEFDRAFDRWRNLYRAVIQDLEAAHRDMIRLRGKEAEEAERRQREALRQRNLLENQDSAKEESDFYPYRYLATEGFLPGYGFPTLPVTAWVPRGEGEFIQRPRRLALREMAPGNLIYHEGGKWAPRRFLHVPGGLASRILTKKQCPACGALAEDTQGVCPHCKRTLEGAPSLMALEFANVALRRRERITANEEERVRAGYRIALVYDLSGIPKHRQRRARGEAGGKAFRLLYAPSAQIYLYNLGSRRDKVEGFYIDLETGDFLSQKDLEERAARGDQGKVERYKLFVRLTQNALFFYPGDLLREVPDREEVEPSLAYALKRGLEAYFQVEESELGVELVGSGEDRAFLFLEEAEGGLGVLRRLLEDPTLLPHVAVEALRVLHFRDGEDAKPDCVRACYECLLSYSNQTVAHLLNRHAVKDLLLDLAQAQLTVEKPEAQDEHLQRLLASCQSELERRFLRFLFERGLRLPDEAQYRIAEAHTVADFLYRPNVVVFVDGPHHEGERQRRIDARQREELFELGYHVLVVPHDGDWEMLVREAGWQEVLGGV
ncbi:DEAD/DEAH box helicase [Thermus scotoductus]|uniref:DEAD/DEAH box helicase n=1 Tax=Thermus scotoductus TaxID=37636 RepID=A0A430V617_THESC|nr:DEAD/DEAH box helicase [Thermus scotoductus]RTI02129.1 DEAD/DEAH box helicase [Thermus scotoductus]RTI20074.1 DEAD/DEAH box helicase [Thermus scotoductus]